MSKFLDSEGISYLWGRIKFTFATKDEIPENISDLTNDSGYITSTYHDETKQDKLYSSGIGQNIKTINNESILGDGNIEILGSGTDGLKIVYVDNANGNDNNSGESWAEAKKTFANALSNASSDCTLFFSGETNERLNIKTNPNQRTLKIIGRDGVRNRILGGVKLTEFVATEYSNIYSISIPNFSAYSSNYYKVVQDNIADTSTSITAIEAHPAQKGREYRLLSTPLSRCSSISALNSATAGFYYDTTNSKMYVKTSENNFVNHPIYCPTDAGGIYGNDGSCTVELTNIEVWYAPLLITNCPNAVVSDCACHFALGTGGIKYDDSVNVTIKRCEASYTINTSGYGDGINAHSSKFESASGTNDYKHKYVSVELIDCWSHDNSDDGWSDHSACEAIIRGGLFEYNHKGGVVPSSGGKCTCYDVMTRKNCRGFYYVSSNTYQKEKTAYFHCANCTSDCEDASRVSQNITRLAGVGFGADDVGVTASGWKGIFVKFINCKSINNSKGFGAGKNTVVNLIDCGTYNVSEELIELDNGTIDYYATKAIKPSVSVNDVILNFSSKALDFNSSFTLQATVLPSDATNKNVSWSVESGGEVISLSPNGLSCVVTSLSSNGQAVVRATTEDGSYTADCAVTVFHKTLIELNYTGDLIKKNYNRGEALDLTGLTFTASYDDGSQQELTASDLTISPSVLTLSTTSVDVSFTYGQTTLTKVITGITVEEPPLVWEQGAISNRYGNQDAVNRIRTAISGGVIDFNIFENITLTTKNNALACYWWYDEFPSENSPSVGTLSTGWTNFSTPVTLNKNNTGNYLRIAVKKSNDANFTASEADDYISVVRNI